MREVEKNRKTEARVSKELQAYGRFAISNCEDDILAWSNRYNDELERRLQETTELQVRDLLMHNRVCLKTYRCIP